MTWFKVDDKLHDHKKIRRARRGGDRPRDAAAMGLWVLAGSWCAANETDGFVPADELDQWDTDAEALAQRLVDAGLWTTDEQDGEDGYLFHAWDEYQPTRATLERRRERNRENMRKAREKGGKGSEAERERVRTQDGHQDDSGEPVGSTPTRPDPTTTHTAAAAAESFDRWWTIYPRKVGKAAAEKAYTKALRSTTADELAKGLANAVQVWRTTGTEPRFIPHPATWLNQGRWADEVPMPGMPDAAPARPATAMLCSSGQPHGPHAWEDSHNSYRCMGVEA